MYTIREDRKSEYEAYAKLNSEDPYSKCVTQYAAQWGALMEQHINDGALIPEIAEADSHTVDQRPGFGITGFMYGCAVRELAQFWIHGEELREWHNAQYGVKATKGVVNPAILVVGGEEDVAH